MANNEIITLDNGLKIILYQDNTKHVTQANLIVNFGSKYKNIKTDNKIIDIPIGTAHFLEHILLEHSPYGNIVTKFKEKNISTNGITNPNFTYFYIDTVKDFEENLIELIKAINTRAFTKEDVETTRHAIIKEKMATVDKKVIKLHKKTYECLFKNIDYPNTLGEIEDIKNISYETLANIYDITYQINNQILVISGNFNKDKILKIIKNTYNEINKKEISYELIKPQEENNINKKYGIVKDDVHLKYVSISYKINISNLTPFERVQLEFMLIWFLNSKFGSSSPIYHNFVKNNICNNNISRRLEAIYDFYVITISAPIISNEEEFIKTIEQALKEKTFNEYDFNIYKKQEIIELILREDSLLSKLDPYISNILIHNYNDIDKIEDIENITFEKYKNAINSLDFSNYSIVKLEKE